MVIGKELIPIIKEIMWELIDNRLSVCLIPSKDEQCAKDGGMIRVATTQNQEWYREMCSYFPRPKQPSQPRGKWNNKRTIVKRKEILKLCERLIKNLKSKSKYSSYVIGEAQRRLEIYTEGSDEWNNQF